MNLSYQLTPWVKRLLIANAVVFALTWVIGREFVLEWFSFQPTKILFRPWTPLTYMFLHGGFGHLFWNMLFLFFFGPQLESKWGSKEFIRYYLVCGLGGVALSFLFVSYSIIGASAAVYGVMLAFAMAWPDAPIYVWGIFPVKAKWLVGFFVLITFTNAFHGRTMATISASNQEKMHKGFQPLLPGFVYCEFDDLEAAEALIGPKTAGFLVEPIQGEGGIRPASQEFMSGLRALCDEHDLMLVLDEVQCGVARTGKLYAYEHYGIEPDIMASAKGIGGGRRWRGPGLGGLEFVLCLPIAAAALGLRPGQRAFLRGADGALW